MSSHRKEEITMFSKHSEEGFIQAMEGIRRKTLVYGEKTLLSVFRMEKGAHLPRHTHPHEQTGYLVKGRMRFFIEEESFEAEAGDSWCVPGSAAHGAEVLEEALVVEVFSPVREDYLRPEI
jgi:quercetin dioxygenase-like cupin family protein